MFERHAGLETVLRMKAEQRHPAMVQQLLASNPSPGAVRAAARFLPRHQLVEFMEAVGVPRTRAILEDFFVAGDPRRTRANLAFLERVLDDLHPQEVSKFLDSLGLRDAQVLATVFRPARAWTLYGAAGLKTVKPLLKKLPPAEHAQVWDELGPKRLSKLFNGLPDVQARALLDTRASRLAFLLDYLKPGEIWRFYRDGGSALLGIVALEVHTQLSQQKQASAAASKSKAQQKPKKRG